MTTTLIIDHRHKARHQPQMPSACGSGCGCASAKPVVQPPSHGRVAVNGVEIDGEAIAREIQHHPAADGDAAWQAAARALVVRELLLQTAQRAGLDARPERDSAGALETAEEALFRTLLDQALDPPKPGEAECRRYYEANLHRFRTPDLIEASHILFEPSSDDAEGWRSAELEARAIAAELGDDPADFGAAAREFSACPTAQQDGSLGQLRRGELVAEVQAALDTLAEGTTARTPVRSRFGWHVLRHQRTIPGRVLPFEMVAGKIADLLEARAWTTSAASYVLQLAGQAEIEGVVIDAAAMEKLA
ncbi:MAG TPA: peptidylprolyl isomerase [Geminicoccus sp.]|uniref:peptidylprolyl isomerase n=1 Tax=Geminicoccus sp. TaxID=2024832 RepID=UPI002C60A27B|nr:peptidylprolyl isomerase [Geminicoccus sp.]HWL69998.1 peptidylprolyl isomerase [Geminicoccus sp.]